MDPPEDAGRVFKVTGLGAKGLPMQNVKIWQNGFSGQNNFNKKRIKGGKQNVDFICVELFISISI